MIVNQNGNLKPLMDDIVQPLINIWDEQWEVGDIAQSNGQKVADTNRIRSANYIPVTPNTQYRMGNPNLTGKRYQWHEYDVNKVFLRYGDFACALFTVGADCKYIMFTMAQVYGTTYNNDISINYPSTYTGYYPSALPKTNAHIGGLGNAIGMRGWNQLNKADKNVTIGGVTYVCNNGIVTLNGTKTNTASGIINSVRPTSISGHKYYVSGCPMGGSNLTYRLSTYKNNSQNILHEYGEGAIFTADESGYYIDLEPVVTNGVTITNLVFKPMLIDLTALFGSGNEPSSVSDFRAMFPAEYYQYCSGSFGDLLWENASHSSAFAAQSVYLDLSVYKFVAIEFCYHSGESGRRNIQIVAVDRALQNLAGLRTSMFSFSNRTAQAYSNRVEFGQGMGGETSWTNNNDCSIPTAIWGIR